MSRSIALCGVTAALAVALMSLGTAIPMTTYVCPVICMLLLALVGHRVGTKLSWVWYAAVCILSVLLTPDKEAAALFVFVGWYPNVKKYLDRWKLGLFAKLILLTGSVCVMYWVLIRLLGMVWLQEELLGDGLGLTLLLLLLANVTFLLLDRLLTVLPRRFGGKMR